MIPQRSPSCWEARALGGNCDSHLVEPWKPGHLESPPEPRKQWGNRDSYGFKRIHMDYGFTGIHQHFPELASKRNPTPQKMEPECPMERVSPFFTKLTIEIMLPNNYKKCYNVNSAFMHAACPKTINNYCTWVMSMHQRHQIFTTACLQEEPV